MDMIGAIQNGDKRIAAKLITMLENNHPDAAVILQSASHIPHTAKIVGITGAPGAGKSTLTDQLAKALLLQNKKIGIVAVDPSSPITGGAFLGDRIRMSDLNAKPDAFIRSMATRGALGGIAKAAAGAVRVMELLGAEYIFIETVGIGQSEIDVANLADTVVLVVVPGMGDDIQAEKAGILEVSDIIAVNKADHEDTNRTIKQLRSMMGLKLRLHQQTPEDENWEAEIISTVATTGDGIQTLMEAIDACLARRAGSVRKPDFGGNVLKEQLTQSIKQLFETDFMKFNQQNHALESGAARLLEAKSVPETESTKIFEDYLKWRASKC